MRARVIFLVGHQRKPIQKLIRGFGKFFWLSACDGFLICDQAFFFIGRQSPLHDFFFQTNLFISSYEMWDMFCSWTPLHPTHLFSNGLFLKERDCVT